MSGLVSRYIRAEQSLRGEEEGETELLLSIACTRYKCNAIVMTMTTYFGNHLLINFEYSTSSNWRVLRARAR